MQVQEWKGLKSDYSDVVVLNVQRRRQGGEYHTTRDVWWMENRKCDSSYDVGRSGGWPQRDDT